MVLTEPQLHSLIHGVIPRQKDIRLILTGVAVPIFYSQAGAASPGRGCRGPMTH